MECIYIFMCLSIYASVLNAVSLNPHLKLDHAISINEAAY